MKSLLYRFGKMLVCFGVLAALCGASQAAGKKYGLFVGINAYPGPGMRLEGAVNDARDMKTLLEKRYGFLKAHTKVLTDAEATRANIIRWLNTYGRLVKAGDIFVFQYSGHGTLVPDRKSGQVDEKDPVSVDIWLGPNDHYVVPEGLYDSAIVPVDGSQNTSGMTWGNLILDDELFNIFTPLVKKGATVIFISDSCHSGTLAKGEHGKIRFARPDKLLGVKSLDELKAPKRQVTITRRAMTGGNYIVLGAAQDDQVAADSDGDAKNGMFSANLMRSLRVAEKSTNYDGLMAEVIDTVNTKSGGDQKPNLDGRFGDVRLKLFALPMRKK